MATPSCDTRPIRTQHGRVLYQVIMPSLAGIAMLGASLLPWLIDPLGEAFSAWQLSIDIGWQLHTTIFSYGLLCLLCASYAFFIAANRRDWACPCLPVPTVPNPRRDRACPCPPVSPTQDPLRRPQTHSTLAGLLCLTPIALFFTQYLFIDMGSIALLAQHEFQAFFIHNHFGYHVAAQFIPIRLDTFDPSTLNGRFALLLDQMQPGLYLPLLATFCLLSGRGGRQTSLAPTVGTGDRKGGEGLPLSGDGVNPSSTRRQVKRPEDSNSRGVDEGLAPSRPLRSPLANADRSPKFAPMGLAPVRFYHVAYADQMGHDISSFPLSATEEARRVRRDRVGGRGVEGVLHRSRWDCKDPLRIVAIIAGFVLLLIVLGRGPVALACRFQAEHLLTTGDYADALTWLDRAARLNPSLEQLPAYHIERGQAWYYLHPTQPSIESQVYLAAFYLTQDDYLAAYQKLMAARQQNVGTSVPFWLIDELSITLTRLAEMSHPLSGSPVPRANKDRPSIIWLNMLIHIDPSNTYAHYTLGRIEYDLHNFTACEKQMLSVIDLSSDPDILSSVYTYLSLSSESEGNYVQARDYLFEAQALDPSYRNNTAREEMSGLH